MKVLIISNFYPPYSIGGYEIGCRDVADALAKSGHQIRVLTSHYGSAADSDERIERSLHHTLPPDGLGGSRSRGSVMLDPFRHWRNRSCIRRTITRYRPDVIFLWNLSLVGHWIFNEPDVSSASTVCYVSDEWLASLSEKSAVMPAYQDCYSFLNYVKRISIHLLSRLSKINSSWPPRVFPLMLFTSRFISERFQNRWGVLPDSKIIPWGVDDQFLNLTAPQSDRPGNEFRIFYAGQIIGFKGVRTAILGVAELVRRHPKHRIVFRLAGHGPASFLNEMRDLIAASGLSDFVTFLGKIDRKEIVAELSNANAYVFPSEWNEPFSISLIEAMGSGCPVVATPTGGSGEILEDRVNSLVYPPGDENALADRLELLMFDPELGKNLGRHAADLIRTSFRLSGMIGEIEHCLLRLLDTRADNSNERSA